MSSKKFQKFISSAFIMILTIQTQVFARNLTDEFKDFCDIMPHAQMKQIAENHLKNDKEFNEAIIFMQSATWANMIREIQLNPEWKKLKIYLNKTGLNMEYMFNSVFLFVTDMKPTPNQNKTNRSLRSFFDDIELILPIGKILAMLHEKKQKSPAFQEFYRNISSPEVYRMFETVRKQPETKRLLIELKSMGARVDDIFELFYGFMNWDSPLPIVKKQTVSTNRTLKEEIDDFKKMVPWEKLKNITDDYLAKDREFGELVVYLQGPKFASIIDAIELRAEYQEIKTYLEDRDIDVDGTIQYFSDLIKNAKPGNYCESQARFTRSVRTYLNEIEDALPVGELLDLFNYKMEHSVEFKKFILKVSEPKIKSMVEEIRALPAFIEIFEMLQVLGVRVRESLIVIYAGLGWGSPFDKPPVKHH